MNNDDIEKEIKKLQRALEAGLFYGHPLHEQGLRDMLSKLGIKSAKGVAFSPGGALSVESLESTLKNVTFDDKNLKLWKSTKV